MAPMNTTTAAVTKGEYHQTPEFEKNLDRLAKSRSTADWDSRPANSW